MLKNKQPYTKKQRQSSRSLQGATFLFDSMGYWDMKKGQRDKQWVDRSVLAMRPARRFIKNGK